MVSNVGIRKVQEYFDNIEESPISIAENRGLRSLKDAVERNGTSINSCRAFVVPTIKDYKNKHHIIIQVYPKTITEDDMDKAMIVSRLLADAINLDHIEIFLGSNLLLHSADFPNISDTNDYYVFDVAFNTI